MNVTIGYTVIAYKEITVNVPDDTPNPTIAAMRLAREQNSEIRHAASIGIKDVQKEEDDGQQIPQS